MYKGFPGPAAVKTLPAHAGDSGNRCDPWVRRSPRGGNGNPTESSVLEDSKDGGDWQVTKSGTHLSTEKSIIRSHNINTISDYIIRCI